MECYCLTKPFGQGTRLCQALTPTETKGVIDVRAVKRPEIRPGATNQLDNVLGIPARNPLHRDPLDRNGQEQGLDEGTPSALRSYLAFSLLGQQPVEPDSKSTGHAN